MAMFAKTYCNVKNVEIAKFFKLASDYAEPITLTVPRTRVCEISSKFLTNLID